ncbi:MAG: glycoside hydrolase [Anaerolineae bacterium]|nr:glycoside hydrolase [Anaerolineae bacterium]
MSIELQATETDTVLVLQAEHSQLEFTIWQAGFKLRRDNGDLMLQSGSDWGSPVSNLNLWAVEEDRAILTFNRGSHGVGRLTVTVLEDGWRFSWDQPTRDTFSLASGKHWYGQGEIIHQLWPMETLSLWEAPLMTWDNGPSGLGDIQEPVWITATGVAVYVENATPNLLVGFNAPPPNVPIPQWDRASSQAPASTRPRPTMPGSSGLLTLMDRRAPLSYLLLVGTDVVDAHAQVIKHVGKPESIPPEALLTEPIWTTWARYKTNISQQVVLDYAKEIRTRGFPGSTLEIDDKWQQNYGDTSLDPARFPEPKAMVATLKEMGFNVTMWVIPFLHPASTNTQQAVRLNYVVRRPDGAPYDVSWWQGTAYLLDVSNPYALEWWAEQLKKLQHSIGLAGYKFDAGEANFLPADAVTFMPINRNEFSSKWVQFGAVHFPYCEVRCGWHGQRYSVLFRQWDKFSVWGLDNGLASIITTGLALGMAGYPFVLPDMIGGNAYGDVLADKELVIRWTQASAPMLAIQFSLAPWDFDEETVAICRKYAKLHVDLAPQRLAAARQATETGAPVIRPVFWGSPLDEHTFTIKDQYMLGDTLLVAPVVTPVTTARDVYLPAGAWRDYWTHEQYSGGQWLRNFPAPLDSLPLFEKL